MDKIRSIFWFNWIGMQIDSTQAHDVRKALELNRNFLGKDGQPDKNAKFSQYKRGERMPNATLIESADRLVPGSRSVIDLPLWRVLRHKGDIAGIVAQWVAMLHPKVRGLMIKRDRSIRDQANDIYLRELGRLATWDCLAGLAIVLRLNIEAGNPEGAWKCAHAIFGLLVVLCPQLVAYGIADELYALFANRFFSLLKFGGYTRAWTDHSFTEMALRAQLRAEREKGIVTGSRRSTLVYIDAAMQESLWGEGKNYLPLLVPDLDLGPPTKNGMLILMQHLKDSKRGRTE
ncbi:MULTISPECIES: hypothetical protein [Burkholderiales]|uniref:hypothetical protein n=1 Tax=Burkholderiales TaxID=80840 RepID=UPI0012ACE876|nr:MULTISPECIES: hypothetical protein [Burkholderiales]MBY4823313.1 hypothetical protein [Burkholderia contaminans]MRT31161.1 hypothetical protein [Herbaspirillum sp. CAH-3]